MINLFHELSHDCSRLTTERYSTSFNSAIRLLHKDLRGPVHDIYGFVRFADEIVDSFQDFDRKALLASFKSQTYLALEERLSLNPILNSFQSAVHNYNIKIELIDAFFNSMEMDLQEQAFNTGRYNEYIYGSAEVVGLMCLHIFCDGNPGLYKRLQPAARSLGAAFQKVNFLRDFKADYVDLKRTYFPGVDFKNFTPAMKEQIEIEIREDFDKARKGILELPAKARFGVYVAYKYYLSLFRKIKRSQPSVLVNDRIRIPNYSKAFIVLRAGLRSQLNIL
jgi:phytoene synthase